MHWFGRWVFRLTCVSLLVGCTASLAGERMKRTVRFAGGLLLSLVLIAPVASFDPAALADQLQQYRADYEHYAERGIFPGGGPGSHAAEIIADRTRAYILERAAALGIECDVEVRCTRGEGDYPYPSALYGSYGPGTDPAALAVLKRQIAAELAIEEQEWIEK